MPIAPFDVEPRRRGRAALASPLGERYLIAELSLEKDGEAFLPKDADPILEEMDGSRRDDPDDGPSLDEELAELFLGLNSGRLGSRALPLAIRRKRRPFPPGRPPQANSVPLAFVHENAPPS